MNQQPTVEEFRKLANGFGFHIPKNAEFYRIMAKEKRNGQIGMKVGEYQHNCHIDTTDIFVLMFIDKDGRDSVESEIELWLRKV